MAYIHKKWVKLNEKGLDYFGFEEDENYTYLAQPTGIDGVYVLRPIDLRNDALLAKEELFVDADEPEEGNFIYEEAEIIIKRA